ncbi:CopG domain protein DNA-binding domain protein [Nostocoides australiense Ben110]|uniref:CopG domain protein DNA-binding domain protein n=1 Tax=Nostocoides australiense Ben110 TaxID=1193182 RepID=W6K0I8_9MICO|nr:ribbon-helix-helix protein, CopG family [Tetrasphaera australiensis]CCH74962.1 CopG domain protein DNA-binding domain protein [Tetrasphaera australiensis Ben110]
MVSVSAARGTRAVPSGVAMNLRLTADETDALRRRAETEGRSMNDVARQAIAEYVSDRRSRLTAAIGRVVQEDAELLDRLSK